MPQKIQPMGLVERREAINAPTVGYASDSTPISTPWPRAGLSPGNKPMAESAVAQSSRRGSVTSTTHTAHSDQANPAAVRSPEASSYQVSSGVVGSRRRAAASRAGIVVSIGFDDSGVTLRHRL